MGRTACVLLNYRNPEEILPLIDSVRRCEWPDKDIYACDNGTNPEAVAFLENLLGKDNVVSNPVNLGFAGGMNRGLQFALDKGAEFVWILSKDMTVESNCLRELHSLWPKLESPGLLGSLTDLNGTEKVYFFRGLIDSSGHTRHGNKGRTIAEIPELRAEWGPTDFVNGSCIFTHRSVIEKIGLIPEDYFLYYEDCEWGERARRAGFKNYVSYRSRVHHRRPVGEFNRTAEFYCRRNAYFFKKRNGYAKPWTKLVELFRTKKNLLKARLKGNRNLSEILEVVEADIRNEKLGPGPWR